MKIVFFGTPQFAADVLQYLLENQTQVIAVISKPDKPQGRSNKLQPVPVKLIAEQWQIPIYQPEKVSDPQFFETLQALNADLFVVVAYGEILKQHVLDLPKKGCINLHASLLPKYRGAAPIQRPIINGEIESGVTIMHLVKKMDAGDMILQVKTPIGPEMTYGELEASLCSIGAPTLLKAIRLIEQNTSTKTLQDESEVTFAPKIELEDCGIDWTRPAKTIHDLIRGVNPEPGAWCIVSIAGESKRLKIFLSRAHAEKHSSPGQIVLEGKRLMIGCGQGVLELLEVQLEGKKRMSAGDFYRGLRDCLRFKV